MENNAIRCGSCQRLLAKGQVIEVQIKCPRCGTINFLRAASPESERHRASSDKETNDGQHGKSPS